MSGPFGSSQWMYASGGFYNGVATQSLRFDPASNPSLTKTPSSASNRKTWTLSFWTKRCGLGGDKIVFNAGVTGTDEIDIFFPSDNFMVSDRSGKQIKTNAVYRDVSSWYHFVIVMDTTEATDTNRLKLYVNGVQETSFNSPVYPTLNQEFSVNNTKVHYVGTRSLGDNDYDGYLAEMNLIDGTALDPTSFGEFKNGVWIAKRYTGSYGTNGFRLQFNQTGTGTASSSTIGADTSGNDNHFSSSGIVASDCDMPDSPENNFSTLNVLQQFGSGGAFAEGNLQYENTSTGSSSSVQATMGVSSGKWYFETVITSASSEYIVIGWDKEEDLSTQGAGTDNSNPVGAGWSLFQSAILVQNAQVQTGVGTATQNDIVGCTIDLDSATRQVKWYKNNSLIATQNILSTGYTHMLPMVSDLSFIGTPQMVLNFGQDSSFAGNKTAQGNTDANGIGDFYYSPPSGYLALCTANLPEPTISPNSSNGTADEYFNTVTYTGNGTGQSITGVGFQSDWTWIKRRSATEQHWLTDSVRGVTKGLYTNLDNAEATRTDQIQSFDTDGFTLGNDGAGFTNVNANTYVSWNWKAGGTAVSNTDGTITSSVSANTDAGFSIVTYTGTGASATVGHGLGVAPTMIIFKNRSIANNWIVYNKDNGNTNALFLNLTNANSTSNTFLNSTTPSSTVFNLLNVTNNNGSGNSIIAYCFHDVDGYSKFGSYTGNGSTDGTFVYTGFRPAFVMLKRSDGTSSWSIRDNTRNDENPADLELRADSSVAEYTESGGGVDLLSNGFKCRTTTGGNNASGGTYIYMAFAEQPFRYANAR